MKWAELSPAWQGCLEESWAAYCLGNVPIGAVVLDAAGQIASRGRNRAHDLDAPPYQTCNTPLAHAELNALLGLGPRPADVHNYALYTTVEPCPLCMGAIYMAGVRQIYFASDDAYAGSTNLLGKTWYLGYKPVKAHAAQRGQGLAEFACALHIEYNLRTHGPNVVVDREREVFPQGVALAEKLLRDSLGQRWAAEGISAAEAYERVLQL